MEQKEKFYNKQWFMWVLLVFLPPIGIIFMWAAKKDLKAIKKVLISVIALFWFLILIALCSSDDSASNDNTPDNSTQSKVTHSDTTTENTEESPIEETTTETPVSLEPFETELSAGHYAAGVDFPAGTYTLTCISGSGNVNSTNMYSGGLNEIMSTDTSDGYSIDSFNNAKFGDGDVLSVSSTAIIKISSDAVDKNSLSTRMPTGTETELTSGNYVAGTDFEPGVYIITCASGSGNVSSSNIYDGGLNEIMATDTSDGYSITTFKNAILLDGTELNISGCTIKLTPSN